jgi:hypothetical protein
MVVLVGHACNRRCIWDVALTDHDIRKASGPISSFNLESSRKQMANVPNSEMNGWPVSVSLSRIMYGS